MRLEKAVNVTDKIIFMDEEPVAIERITVNEGFNTIGDRIFTTVHHNIADCNKGDDQNTAFYYSILEVIEE